MDLIKMSKLYNVSEIFLSLHLDCGRILSSDEQMAVLCSAMPFFDQRMHFAFLYTAKKMQK
jgi:hypothetical protein